jgi:large subunit ribosomal protein L17
MNMANSLILHKKINTTVQKARELRKYLEPLITKSKNDTTHSRRTVFSYLRDKESIKVLFTEIAEKVADRPGGYTRILKTGRRLGDNAEMCLIELVDFNEIYTTQKEVAKTKTRRGRGKKSTSEVSDIQDAEVIETATIQDTISVVEDVISVEDIATESIVSEETESTSTEEIVAQADETSTDVNTESTDNEEETKEV